MHAKLKKVDLLLCAFINNSRIKVFYCEIEEQGKTAMPPMFKKMQNCQRKMCSKVSNGLCGFGILSSCIYIEH